MLRCVLALSCLLAVSGSARAEIVVQPDGAATMDPTVPQPLVTQGVALAQTATTLNFDDLGAGETVAQDRYAAQGVLVETGPGSTTAGIVIGSTIAGPCNGTRSIQRAPFVGPSFLFRFPSGASDVTLSSGDFGPSDQDVMTLTAYSDDALTMVVATSTVTLAGGAATGCLSMAVAAERIAAVEITSAGSFPNSIFVDDLTYTPPVSNCETTLPFALPTAFGANQVSQDYSEFDGSEASRRRIKPHYHTGIDLGSPVPEGETDRSQEIFPMARGEVIALCPNVPGGCNFGGTQFSEPFTDDNHGLQGVVILKHTVVGDSTVGSSVIYSMYVHLGTVKTFQPNECIEQSDLIGKTGGLHDGHLHFEVKSAPVLSNPVVVAESCIDPGTQTHSNVCFGYTLVNPNTRGYHDPVEYLHSLDKSGFPKAVTLSDEKDKAKKITARSGPGAFDGAYPPVGKAEEGSYTALSKVVGATTDPSCADSWYQIQRASNDCSMLRNCFTHNEKSTKDGVPEAWVCGDFVKE